MQTSKNFLPCTASIKLEMTVIKPILQQGIKTGYKMNNILIIVKALLVQLKSWAFSYL